MENNNEQKLKSIALKTLNEQIQSQTQECNKKIKYAAYSLFITAWGFLFTVDKALDKFLLSLIILLFVIFMACDILRNYGFVVKARKLHKDRANDEIGNSEVLDKFNENSDQTYRVMDVQLILLTAMLVVLSIFIIGILL